MVCSGYPFTFYPFTPDCLPVTLCRVSLAPGTRLGPYEIVSPLGAGGMGEVYKARDSRLDRTVAIKVLPAALGGDRGFRERFDREARAISALEHPHICPLYDVGESAGTGFLVMQYPESAGSTSATCVRMWRGSCCGRCPPRADAIGAAALPCHSRASLSPFPCHLRFLNMGGESDIRDVRASVRWLNQACVRHR
jgi:hypothetical protein